MSISVKNNPSASEVYQAESLSEAYDIVNRRDSDQDYNITISQSGSDGDLSYTVSLYDSSAISSTDKMSSVDINLNNSITEDANTVFSIMKLLAQLSNDMREMATNQKWFEFDQYQSKMQDYINKIQDEALKQLVAAAVTSAIDAGVATINAYKAGNSMKKSMQSIELKKANYNDHIELQKQPAAKADPAGMEGQKAELNAQKQAGGVDQNTIERRKIRSEELSAEASSEMTKVQIRNTLSQSASKVAGSAGNLWATQDRIAQEEAKIAAEKEKMFVDEWSNMAQHAQELLTKLLSTLEQMLRSIHEAKNIRF